MLWGRIGGQGCCTPPRDHLLAAIVRQMRVLGWPRGVDAMKSRDAKPVNLLAQLAARERELRAKPSRKPPHRLVIGALAATGLLTIAAATALHLSRVAPEEPTPIIAAPAPPPVRVQVVPATSAIRSLSERPPPVTLPEVVHAPLAPAAPPFVPPVIRPRKMPAQTTRAEVTIEPYRNGMPATRLTGEALRLALIEDSRITREFNAASLRRVESSAAIQSTRPD